jgi:putative ATP-dependent endonuclease of OLD family
MSETSRLIKMRVSNLGCIGPEGCETALDSILCLVSANKSGKSTFLCAYELALGTATFNLTNDLCRRARNAPAKVEIGVISPRAWQTSQRSGRNETETFG